LKKILREKSLFHWRDLSPSKGILRVFLP
jgi:hypothetical protein